MEQGTTAKLCECDCGQPAPIATRNHARSGHVKGQPVRFIKGHGRNAFKGDAAGYTAIHTHLRKYFPKSGVCDECGETKRTEYALIKGREYSRNREDYRELCKLCHNRYDEIGGSRWRGVETARKTAGEAPPCRCGCGEPVAWDYSHRRWFAYRPGHRPAPAQRGPRPKSVITCKYCRNQFEGRADAQFCSRACNAAHRRASGVDDVERTCHRCGSAFTCSRYDGTKHCSKSCGIACSYSGDCPG